MVTYNHEDDKLRCTFSGRIDTNASQEMEQELFAAIDKAGSQVVFDLADVDYISSAFLRICLRAAKLSGEDKFKVVGVQPGIKKVFKIAAFDKIIDIE